MRKNFVTAKDSSELYKSIRKELSKAKRNGYYIVDRNKTQNFGTIFREGVSSYSSIDLFCERFYKKSVVEVLNKPINTISEDDQAIIDEYIKATDYLENLPKDFNEIDTDKVNYYSMVANDLPTVIRGIEPIEKNVDIPFYVNWLTKEEFPLVSLETATEENLDKWARKLTVFAEVNKDMITPAAFSPYSQPNGLMVMIIRTPQWVDLVIR